MYWFTSDQHFGHANIIQYCQRPFTSIEEMDHEIIERHNKVVNKSDIVIHAGDFTLIKDRRVAHEKYISKLKGDHIFLKGSHDRWLSGAAQIWEKRLEKHYIVVCHYALRVWARSHYGSWNLYGHSHNKLPSIGKSHDIGVDGNNFYPYNLEQIIKIMEGKPDNPNLIRRN